MYDSLKARQHNHSMPFLMLISQLCDQVGISYFSSDESVPDGGVIDVGKKRVAASPTMKRRRIQFDQTPVQLGNVSGEEDLAPPQTSPIHAPDSRAYQELIETTYRTNKQLNLLDTTLHKMIDNAIQYAMGDWWRR